MIKILKFFIIFFVFAIFYSIHYFILTTISSIYNFPFPFLAYAFPISIMITLSFSTQASYSYSVKLYAIIYWMSTSYLGLILNTAMCCFYYKCINWVFHIEEYRIHLGTFMAIILPFIISLYGVIKASIITIDKEINIVSSNCKEKCKIVHLSDLHLGAIYQTRIVEKIDNKVIKINPDIVEITGDLVDSSMCPCLEWLKPFAKIKVPILYITGNHEEIVGTDKVMSILKHTNITHIGKNLSGFLYNNNINFIGIDYEYDINKRVNEIEIPKDKVNILLTHVPVMTPKELVGSDITLLLCGHTHGGQMFPLHITSYLNSKCFKGLYEYMGKFVYVSSGIGTAVFPMRTLSQSTIGVINVNKFK